MLRIGSHVSMSGKHMLLAASQEAVSYGANTFMIYTGAPQNTRRKKIEDLNIEAGHICKKTALTRLSYTRLILLILATRQIRPLLSWVLIFFVQKLNGQLAIGAKQIVLHPGAHVGAGAEAGIKKIIEGLNEVIDPNQNVQIALETMAGKGSECGRSFEELAQIIEGVTHNEQLSVCFDTCHTHDAGYNIVEDFDGVLNEFDKIIGIDRIKVLHINDSKNVKGARKDRHENIGFGEIGFDALQYVVHHEQLKDIPKILETPYVGEDKKNKKPPYRFEIEMLKEKQFDDTLLEKILQQ